MKKTQQMKPVANLKKASVFSKDVVYIKAYAILMKDREGQVIFTFDTKKKADTFFKELTK